MDGQGILIFGLALEQVVALVIIVAASGFVSGLSGFGFSAIGATTLWILPPQQAIPLLMALSAVNQVTSMRELGPSISTLHSWWPSGATPFIVGGLFGIPAGLWVLSALPAAKLCAAVGAVLITYSAWALFKPAGIRIQCASPAASIAVGALGGVIGGCTAFPSSAIVIWAGLTGMQKESQRAVVQPYILTMQIFALLILTLAVDTNAKTFGAQFWPMFLSLALVVVPFTKLGVAAFRKISDIDFKRVTNALLCISGAGLAIKGSPAIFEFTHALKASAIASLTW
jgi:uncharacterized protein